MARKKRTAADLMENRRDGIIVMGASVSNFGLSIRFRIQSAYGDISWLIAVQPDDGDDVMISLSNKEFATPAAFHEALLRYGFVFRGEKPALNIIKEALIPDAEQAEAISSVGYHPGSGLFFYVNGAQTAAGQFIEPDEFGMIRHEKQAYFLPFAQDPDNKNFKTFLRVRYEPGELNLAQWVERMAAAHKKSLFPVCFRIAAYFRDIAFTQVHFFPLLYLEGVPNAGKTTLARSLTALDGQIQDDLNMKNTNTIKAIPRRLEQISNSIVWCDEWKNTLPDSIKGTLQASYDGGGYNRAVNGYSNLTNSVDVLSALVLTSNEFPAEEYMRQRCIFILFPDAKTDAAQHKAFSELTGLEIGNMSSVGSDILTFRKVIEAEWKETYRETYQHLIKALPEVERRICNNMAVILTPAIILERKHVINLQKTYKLKESLLETGKACCVAQQEILTGRSELSQFFEVLAYCAERNVIREGEDYRYSKDGKTLSIRMPRVYPIYLREVRAMFNKVGADREEITGEIKRHPCCVKVDAFERFTIPGSARDPQTGEQRTAVYPAIKVDAVKFAGFFPLALVRQTDK